ncbi:class E sortase [uncultured Jatrophihabitans sp.]|uniref:class E sortase n=1 Tax=uncultured Jatrophihabitans sp. TaxID=1610747 RepID=UPI0035CA0075
MTDTAIAEPSPPPAHRAAGRSVGDRIRFVLRGIGQTLITAGLVVLLFVVYEVWITNLFADREQSHVADTFKKEIVDGKDPLLPLPGSKDPTIPLGDGIAVLYIPRLGKDFHFAIVQGSVVPTDGQLEKGPAHYRDTQLPGQVGNFAMAGHRVGKGEPFLNLDQLRAGDSVIVETGSYWYVYRVKGQQHGLTKKDDDGIAGRQIVSPTDGNVLLPVPNHQGAKPTEALLTMTTCHPKYSANKRMIIHAALDSSATVKVAAQSGNAVLTMPDSIKALFSAVST